VTPKPRRELPTGAALRRVVRVRQRALCKSPAQSGLSFLLDCRDREPRRRMSPSVRLRSTGTAACRRSAEPVTALSPTSARWPPSCPAGPTSSAPRCRPSAEPAARRRLSPRPRRWWPRRSARPAVHGSGWRTAGSTGPASQPSAFFDVTHGGNDLDGVGCCRSTVGYDLASGLGVPNWPPLPATLPKPG
jgi:hypothetical protein